MDANLLAELGARLEGALSRATERINECLRDDEEFREICSDYQQCADSLREWRQLPDSFAERIAEYSELLAELEREILSHLQSRQ